MDESRQKALEVAQRLASSVLGKRGAPPMTQADGRNVKPRSSPKLEHRLDVPDEPQTNFFGLLIGPGGETQKWLEQQSGARIWLRGRGSSKDGRDEDAEKPLHVLFHADTQEQMDAAVRLVSDLLFNPEARQRLKEQQMASLAQLNQQPSHGGGGGGGYGRQGFSQGPGGPGVGGSHGGFHGGPGGPGGPNDGPTVVVEVEARHIGYVIGRGGQTIRQVQEETGAQVQVDKDHDRSQPVRKVFISGAPDCMQRAKERIERIVAEREGRVSRDHGGMGGDDRDNDPTLPPGVKLPPVRPGEDRVQLYIPNECVGLLIGRGGDTIRQIQERCQGNIQVTRDTLMPPGSTDRLIFVQGLQHQIDSARQEIQRIVDQHAERHGGGGGHGGGHGGGYGGGHGGGYGGHGGGGGGGYGGGHGGGGYGGQHQGPSQEVLIEVPGNVVGTLIGRGGETVRGLQQRTGCRIQVARADKPSGMRDVTLTGSPQLIQNARQAIDETIGRGRARDVSGQDEQFFQQQADSYGQQMPLQAAHPQGQPQQQQQQQPQAQQPQQQQQAPALSPAMQQNPAFQQQYAQLYQHYFQYYTAQGYDQAASQQYAQHYAAITAAQQVQQLQGQQQPPPQQQPQQQAMPPQQQLAQQQHQQALPQQVSPGAVPQQQQPPQQPQPPQQQPGASGATPEGAAAGESNGASAPPATVDGAAPGAPAAAGSAQQQQQTPAAPEGGASETNVEIVAQTSQTPSTEAASAAEGASTDASAAGVAKAAEAAAAAPEAAAPAVAAQ